MKKENSMDSKINNKPLMLLYPELCPSAQLANTETMKFPNQPSKLMTQMIWFLKKQEDKKFMHYQERGHFLNFISGN